MMNNNSYINQYQKNQIETASPEQILIMLYNAAINFLNKAKINLNENNDETFHHNMTCCKNIIAEFMGSLIIEDGDETAQVLYGLYRYLRKLCITSDITKNAEGIDEILKHLIRLRDTWVQAIKIATKERQEQAKQDAERYGSSDSDEDYDDEDEEETEEKETFYGDV